MNWRSIRLELGHTDEHPRGSVSCAYLLRLPLDEEDRIDAPAVEVMPLRASFRRHWSADPDERGLVVRDGNDWVLRCNECRRTIQFGTRPLHLGAEFRITEPNGDVLPLRVTSVR